MIVRRSQVASDGAERLSGRDGYSASSPLGPGMVVAERYRLRRLLGEGGMGQVWAATHVATGRAVAIKRLFLPHRPDEERHARSRFLLEARAACAVDHPNVVEVLDYVAGNDGSPLLVMELLQGETLAARLERVGRLDVAETARLLLPVVSAIGTAHARGIVHRDLKPANIFVSRRAGGEEVVKLLDFGIAKWLDPDRDDCQPCTRTGATLGTPVYMAPEQAVGADSIDYRVDIWSLGVILYECLTGVRPVDGKNAAQVMMRLLNTGITPIESLLPELRDDLAELIGRMLSQDAGRRPSDLHGLFAVLSACTSSSAPSFPDPGGAPAFDRDEPLTALQSDQDQSGVRGRELATRTLERPEQALGTSRRWATLFAVVALISLLVAYLQ